jgi:hypothetical protein
MTTVGFQPFFAAAHESAYGTKQTSQKMELMSAFGSKADMAPA